MDPLTLIISSCVTLFMFAVKKLFKAKKCSSDCMIGGHRCFSFKSRTSDESDESTQ